MTTLEDENEIAQLRAIIKTRDKEIFDREILLKACFIYVRRHYLASHAGTGQSAWSLMNKIQEVIGTQPDGE